tara:strand:- start:406 stop:546 length:141 start_codon:yes stop_codon:yes gene_type:complete
MRFELGVARLGNTSKAVSDRKYPTNLRIDTRRPRRKSIFIGFIITF